MIVATLPSSPAHPVSEKQLSDSPSSPVKASRQPSKASTTSKSGSPLSPRAQGKQAQRTGPLPTDSSFVLLQDSVIRNIPAPLSSPPRSKKGLGKSRNSPNIPQPTKPLEPEQETPSPLSHHLRSTARLFNLLSTRTDIDHPLCAECTQILLSDLQKQLDETKKERDGYIAFEKEVRKERERESQAMTLVEAEKRIEKLKIEEKFAIEQLVEAERERGQLDDELRLLELDEKALEAEEAE